MATAAKKIRMACEHCQREGHPSFNCPMRPRETGEDLCKLTIGLNRYLVGSKFRDDTYIHIREYIQTDDGKDIPSKKGIALTPGRWKLLTMYTEQIDEAMQSFLDDRPTALSLHLGGNVYLTLKTGYPCVDIRQFYMAEGETEIRATKRGIALKFAEYEKLKTCIEDLKTYIPELEDVIPCCFSSYHSNQLTWYACPECCPNQMGQDSPY